MAGKFGKYLNQIGKEYADVGRQIKQTVKSPTNGVASTLGAAALTKGTKSMVTKTDPAFHNLWTGYREGPGAIGLATVGALGYGYVQSEKQTRLAPKLGEVSYGGVPAVMNADGVSTANQTPMGAGAPTLGATGNMVFGLHNARKG